MPQNYHNYHNRSSQNIGGGYFLTPDWTGMTFTKSALSFSCSGSELRSSDGRNDELAWAGLSITGNTPPCLCLSELLYSCVLMLLKNLHISLFVHVPVGGSDIWDSQVGCQTVVVLTCCLSLKKSCKNNDKQTERSKNRWCRFGCFLLKACDEKGSSGELPSTKNWFLKMYTIAHESTIWAQSCKSQPEHAHVKRTLISALKYSLKTWSNIQLLTPCMKVFFMCSWTDLCLSLSLASKEEKRDHWESRWSQCNKMHFVVLNGYFQSGYEVFLTNHAARLNPLTVHVSVSAVIAIFRFATMQFGSWHKRREKRSVAKLIFSWISALLSSCPPQCSSSCFLHSSFFSFQFPIYISIVLFAFIFLIFPSYLLASSPLCFHFIFSSHLFLFIIWFFLSPHFLFLAFSFF